MYNVDMAARRNLCIVWMVFICFEFEKQSVAGRLIDLTYDMEEMSVTYPSNPKFNLTILNRGPWNKVPWVENNRLTFVEHTGTHMDAPAHFGKGNWRVHHIPLERLLGPGVVINIKEQVSKNRDYRVSVDDLKKWESKHGNIPKGAYLLMNSGWGKNYPDWNAVWGSETVDDLSSYHFPSWHENAVQWLVNKRDISGIGVDTPSLDYGPSSTFPVHQLCGKERILGIENVAYIDKLPEAGATVYASLMKVHDGSGAPLRLFATTDDDTSAAVSLLSIRVAPFLLFLQLFILFFL